MDLNLIELSPVRNVSSQIGFQCRQEIFRHYSAGKTDQQIADETKLPRHVIEEFRIARFLKAN